MFGEIFIGAEDVERLCDLLALLVFDAREGVIDREHVQAAEDLLCWLFRQGGDR